MAADDTKATADHVAVRGYLLLCLLALLILGVTLMGNGGEWWAFVLVLFGLAVLLTRWSLGPVFLLIGLTALTTYQARWQRYYAREEETGTPADLIACLAALVYVAGNYRFQSLMREVFPAAERSGAKARRDPDSVSGSEVTVLLLTLPLWVAVAFLIWLLLPEDSYFSDTPLGITSPRLWRLMVLVLLAAPVLGLFSVLGRYRALTRASPEESLLFLQDQVWRATRREQSRLNRWLVWARRRAQRRKEGT